MIHLKITFQLIIMVTYKKQKQKEVKLSITEMSNNLFQVLMDTSLDSSVYTNIINELRNNLCSESIRTTYKRNSDVLTNLGVETTNEYRTAFSELQKLGIILKHNGYIYLNPLLAKRLGSKTSLALDYYELLWDYIFTQTIKVSFKETRIYFQNSESLKRTICDEYELMLVRDPVLKHLTSDEIYNYCFNKITKKDKQDKEVEDYSKLNNLETQLNILAGKITKIYFNLSHKFVSNLAYQHFLILKEQLTIMDIKYNLYNFPKHKLGDKLISFKDTKYYKTVCKEETVKHQQILNLVNTFDDRNKLYAIRRELDKKNYYDVLTAKRNELYVSNITKPYYPNSCKELSFVYN